MVGDGSDDWLAWHDDALKGVTLHRRTYFQWAPNWDHDHCEFCQIAFVVAGDAFARPPYATEGWTIDDEYSWICDRCFETYRARFGWTTRDRLPTDRPDTPPPASPAPVRG